jgi:GNAT superfamily N-acetyltransferase
MEISIRTARTMDLPWLRQLMVDSSIYNIPVGRDIPNAQVQQAVLRDFDGIVAGADDLVILVAETEHAERMGFMLLMLNQLSHATGELQGQVYSIAIEPRFWGSAAASRLVQEAARVTGDHGHRYLVGQITADNLRMKQKSLRMGFEVEGYEIVMACTLDGPAPMPGRPESQRAHDVSRRQRKLLARRRAKKKLREKRRQRK